MSQTIREGRMAQANPQLTQGHIRSLAEVLGATDSGFTGSEIGRLLSDAGIEDVNPGATKRHRLAEALIERAQRDVSSNRVLAFVQDALQPVRNVGASGRYEHLLRESNAVLGFVGLEITDSGELVRVRQSKTLSDAQQRRKRMYDEMIRRHLHSEVLKYCKEELLRDDCFHSVFEATKGLCERVRGITGLTTDGAQLVQDAFSISSGKPMVAFNSLRSESEKSEQKGLVNLMVGVLGTFRNPTAHAPKVVWHVSEPDALDLLTTLSLLHRRLDTAVLVP